MGRIVRTQNNCKANLEVGWFDRAARSSESARGVPSSHDRNYAKPVTDVFSAAQKVRSCASDELEIHLVRGCANFDIVLLPGFDGYNLSAVVDVLSTANRVARSQIYAYRLFGVAGTSTTSSSGFEIDSRGTLDDVSGKANIIIVGSCGAATQDFPPISNWLRHQSRLGSQLIGIGNGVSILAAAGVTYRRRVAAAWQARLVWREIYPDTEFIDSVFVVDDSLTTTPGGRATVHMAIAIVRKVSGSEIGKKVADVLNLARVREPSELVTSAKGNVNGAKGDILIRAREEMRDNLERPISSEALARQLKISTRQLQRIFKARLNTNPRTYYVACRLDYARDLIQQTEMSVTEAAVAAGFVSLSHFSKCYRRRFGIYPRHDRQLQ